MNEKDKWITPYKTKIDELNERQFINHTNLVDLSIQFNDEVNVEIRKTFNLSRSIKFGRLYKRIR